MSRCFALSVKEQRKISSNAEPRCVRTGGGLGPHGGHGGGKRWRALTRLAAPQNDNKSEGKELCESQTTSTDFV